MKRKIVRQGAATLMVSLPAKWARDHGLDKGDEVVIDEDNQTLIIRTEESSKKEYKAKINVSDLAPLTNVVLIDLYIKGVDELEVIYDKPEILKKYQLSTINELIGFEIIKQTHNSILLKDISDENQNIDELIKRIFFILDSMIEELVEAIEKKQSLDPIIDIDTSVNKFANFCLRIINKKGYPEIKKSAHIYSIVRQLEEIGDDYKSIAKAIRDKEKPDKNQVAVLKQSRLQLQYFKDALFNFNMENALKFARKYEDIKTMIKEKNRIDFLLHRLNHSIIQMNHPLLVMNLS